jgi:hypothetical protein
MTISTNVGHRKPKLNIVEKMAQGKLTYPTSIKGELAAGILGITIHYL